MNQADIYLEHPFYYLAFIAREDAMKSAGEKNHQHSHQTMSPASYNKNSPVALCPWW